MKERYMGVSTDSDVYFHSCSMQAKKLYFYPLCAGRYFCDGDYSVNRANYIKDVALRSGFNTEAAFCTTFKKVTGHTPKTFRMQPTQAQE